MSKEITIFSKKRKSRDGRAFYSFITRMVNKTTGEEVAMDVRFRETAGMPDPSKCPCNIRFEKPDANIATRTYTREDTGEICEARSLWLTKWEYGSEYVDTSMDDYM